MKILLIDDNSEVLFLLSAVLSSRGYHVLTAENKAEADQVVAANKDIAAIITDKDYPLQLGEKPVDNMGLTFLEEMQTKLPRAVRGLMSGLADEPHIQERLRRTTDFVLKKPFTVDQPADRIKKFLRQRQAR